MRNGSWELFKEIYREEEKSSELTLERIREACEKVASDEIGRLGILQEILREWEVSPCRMFARIATV